MVNYTALRFLTSGNPGVTFRSRYKNFTSQVFYLHGPPQKYLPSVNSVGSKDFPLTNSNLSKHEFEI